MNAVRIYVANLMTEPGETDDYTLDDHLRAIRAHTGFDLFDYVLVNGSRINSGAAERYRAKGSTPVRCDRPLQWAGRARVLERDLAPVYGEKIRHDPSSLARAIRELIANGRHVATPEAPRRVRPPYRRHGYKVLSKPPASSHPA